MPFYRRILPVIAARCPSLLEPQATGTLRVLALLVGALLAKRSLCLTTLAKAFPVPEIRQVPDPKHELLHRLKRLSRFLGNDQVDPVAIQVACIPAVVAKLGAPRRLGLTIDWTSFDVTLPRLAGGGVRKYQVLTIAVPRRRRSLPLLSVTYERDKLPSQGSQNRREEDALARVLAALPKGVRPVVLAGTRRSGCAASAAPGCWSGWRPARWATCCACAGAPRSPSRTVRGGNWAGRGCGRASSPGAPACATAPGTTAPAPW